MNRRQTIFAPIGWLALVAVGAAIVMSFLTP